VVPSLDRGFLATLGGTLQPRNRESALRVCFASAAVRTDTAASYDVSAARASRLRVNFDSSGISSIGGSGDGARRNAVPVLSGRPAFQQGKVQAQRLCVAMVLIIYTSEAGAVRTAVEHSLSIIYLHQAIGLKAEHVLKRPLGVSKPRRSFTVYL
jgi:hypothetical protein